MVRRGASGGRSLTAVKSLARHSRAQVRRLLLAQDAERRRLSLGVHGAITPLLAALSANLDLIDQHAAALNPRARAMLAESRVLARQGFREARRFVDQLYPPLVSEAGLALALRSHIESFAARTGANIDFWIEDGDAVPRDVQMLIFRLVEDCLDNVPRPPQINPLFVSLMAEPDAVKLLVRPLRRDTALRCRRVCRLHLGDEARVRFTRVPASEQWMREADQPLELVLTIALDID